MPMPKPTDDETMQDFINRCMSDSRMMLEYPQEKNRAGVCYTQWQRSGKSEGKMNVLIAEKNTKKQIATGPVLVPGETDKDGEAVTREHIADVAEYWMEHYRIVDKGHTLQSAAVPVESWITRAPLKFRDINNLPLEIPAGTWMMSVKIHSARDWAKVENGEFKGFSIMAVPGRVDKSAGGEPDAAEKKTLLKDLGNEPGAERWIVTAVSLVDDPAVPKSRWVALKSADKKRSLFDRLFGGVTDKSKTEKNAAEGGNEEENEMDKETIKQYAKEALKEMQAAEEKQSLEQRLKNLEEQIAAPGADKEAQPEEKTGEAKNKPEGGEGKGEGTDNGIDAIKQRLITEKLKLADLYDSDEKDKDEKIERQKRKVAVLAELVEDSGSDKAGKSGGGGELPEEVKKRLERLERAVAAKSRGLSGQDGAEPLAAEKEEDPFPRDALGRRIYR